MSNADRGQAYTLEGFIAAMVVLTAVLFALQSVVITPTTGGFNDRTVQAQTQQQLQDALIVSADDGNLSETVRYWDGEGGFNRTNVTSDEARGVDQVYSVDEFANVSQLGAILNESFAQEGWNYNVELYAIDEADDSQIRTLVYQGSPSSSAVVASTELALYDDHRVGPDWNETASDVDTENQTVPDGDGPSHLYNVVEVRVILW